MAYKPFLAAAALAVASGIAPLALADSTADISTGRYSRVANVAEEGQRDPLRVVINVRIPAEIETVGGAVDYLLNRSGFRLADDAVLTKEAKILLAHPLPQVHRKIGPMTLDEALQMFAGDAFQLVVDPVHRKVAYVLADDLRRTFNG